MLDKKTLRREVRARVAQIAAADALERSETIGREVEGHLAVSGARVVALFSPLGDEPQLWPLVERLAKRMSVVLPRVEGDDMEFYDYDSRAMQIGSFGIVEPQGVEPVEAEQIDLMVVPGVAFTAAGDRLGRGKGYYDRYLSREGFRAFCVGVCYEHQVVESLPVEPHDKAMDEVVSSNSK